MKKNIQQSPLPSRTGNPKCKNMKRKENVVQESFLRHPITSLHNKSIFAFNKNAENNSVNVSEAFSSPLSQIFPRRFSAAFVFFFLVSQLAHSLFITCSHTLLLCVCACSSHLLKLLCAAGLIRHSPSRGPCAHFSPHTHSARNKYTHNHTPSIQVLSDWLNRSEKGYCIDR